jgi:hypothetical protein
VTVPAPYLTPAQVRSRVTGTDALSGITDEAIAAFVAEFEEIAEQYLGTAFRVRHVSAEQVSLVSGQAMLQHYNPSNVVVTDADSHTVPVIASITGRIVSSGLAPFPDRFGDYGYIPDQPVTVAYDHGFADPPATVLRACAEYVRACKVQSSGAQPETAQSYSVDNYTYRQTKPDWNGGSPTGFRTVDRLLNSSSINVRIPGVA